MDTATRTRVCDVKVGDQIAHQHAPNDYTVEEIRESKYGLIWFEANNGTLSEAFNPHDFVYVR
jgi:hypothetical protein